MFSRLLEGDFGGYFAEQADVPGDLWFFLHIPKTAGSSFWHEFTERLRPHRNIEIKYAPERTADESRRLALDGLIEVHRGERVRAARAHLKRRELDALLTAEPRTRLVTMLRKPLDRVISDFRYSRTPAHPPHLSVIAKYPTLSDYFEDPAQQNKMVKCLQLRNDESVASIRERLLREFAFVGFLESYPICRRAFCRLLGKRAGPMTRLRVTESRSENEVQVDAQLRKRITRLNERDEELFTSLFDAFRPMREPLRAWLKANSG